MNLLDKVWENVQDARGFGPSILQRVFAKVQPNNARVVKTRFGEFLVRRHESDMSTLRSVYLSREYDLDKFAQGVQIRRAYEEMLKNNKRPIIIDAGANVGYSSRFFATAYPDARIVAVEPDRENAALCRNNTSGFLQVEVIEAAIGCRSGRVSLNSRKGASNAIQTSRSDGGIKIITIDELKSKIVDGVLFIVKIDIEGFESDLFSDNIEWIAEPSVVIVEPHDWLLPGQGSSQMLQQKMLGQGREMLICGENIAWIKSAH